MVLDNQPRSARQAGFGKTLRQEVGKAVWWTPVSMRGGELRVGGKDGISCLEGELHLDLGLLPSNDLPFYSVSVRVSCPLRPSQ